MARKHNPEKKAVLGNLSEAMQLDVASIPLTDYSYLSEALPVPNATLAADYGEVIDPLQVFPGQGASNRTTSLVRSQTVEEFTYATHIGVVVVPDCKQFALNGVDTLQPTTSSPVPQFDGFVPPTGIITNATGPVRDATSRPASFVWGHDALQAAWALLNAYRLRMTIGSRYQIFDELAANVGACVSGEMRGFGNSLLSPVDYIRRQNALAAARAAGVPARMFLPQTVTAGDPVTPAQPPLVSVSYGGARLSGAFGGWYPLRGLLLGPGMPLNLLLERADGGAQYYDRMIASLRDTQEVAQTYAANLTDAVTGGIGFAGPKVWKGGLFRVGILIRGFGLSPLACYQGYQDMSRYFNGIDKAQIYRDSTGTLMEMLRTVIERAGSSAFINDEPLEKYVSRHSNSLKGGVSDIDNIDFSRLMLPAPLADPDGYPPRRRRAPSSATPAADARRPSARLDPSFPPATTRPPP